MTKHTTVWQRIDSTALEYLTATKSPDSVKIDSVVIGVNEDNISYRLHYQIECDTHYQVRQVDLHLIGHEPLRLTTDGAGHWFDAANQPLPQLDGCIDIDITATPFTNTLPVRRLTWQPGQRRTLHMVYFYIPEMTFELTSRNTPASNKRRTAACSNSRSPISPPVSPSILWAS